MMLTESATKLKGGTNFVGQSRRQKAWPSAHGHEQTTGGMKAGLHQRESESERAMLLLPVGMPMKQVAPPSWQTQTVNQMMTPVHIGMGMPVRMMPGPGAGRPQQPHILCINQGTYPQLVPPSIIAVAAIGHAAITPLPGDPAAGFKFQMTPQPQYWMMPSQLQMAVPAGGVQIQRPLQPAGTMASHLMFPEGYAGHGHPLGLVRQVHSLTPLSLGVQQQSAAPIALPMPFSKTKTAPPPPTPSSPGVGMPAGPGLFTISTANHLTSGGKVATAAADAGAPASGQWPQETCQESESCRSGPEFPCTHAGCKDVFYRPSPSQLNKHAYIHTDDRPFSCTVCGNGFRTKWTLKKHTRTHTGEKPFSCEDCNRTFTQRGSWRRHVFANHRKDIEARLNNPKMYRCGQCTKCFKFERNLINHLPTHDNDDNGSDPESFDSAVVRGRREEGEVTPPTTPTASPTATAATSTVTASTASSDMDDANALLSLAASRRPE